MNNDLAWEREYRNPQFLTLGTEPLADVRDFMKWLRRKQKIDTTEFAVLDLGCGNGKNLIYAVDQFCKSGIGYDISPTAITQAEKLSQDQENSIHYQVRSIGSNYPLEDNSINVIIDATSSHCLNQSERAVYLKEIFRVLKPGGWLFVRTLCLDGDKNAKQLLAEFPGPDPQSYVLPEVGITETVFIESQLKDMYIGAGFNLDYSEKSSGYQKWGNQSYKRNYWIGYFQKNREQR